LLVAGALLALAPTRYLADGQGTDLAGRFDGRPIEAPWLGQRAAPFGLALDMERGQCEFVKLDGAGAVLDRWSAQKITVRGRIEPSGKLQLRPGQDAAGRFRLRVGKFIVLGPLLTVIRGVILAVCLAGIAATPSGWRIARPGQSLRRWRVAGLVLAFSGLVLYSVVHEGGHLLFGALFGGQQDWQAVRWTVFSGEQPHVVFRRLPEAAMPWMSAGGILLPTLVAVALLLLWHLLGRGATWWLQLLAVLPALALLLGNLGLLADAGHTLRLATHLGLRGAMAQVAACSPAVVTLVCFAPLCCSPESNHPASVRSHCVGEPWRN
jgi:hypothetical protein